MQLRKVIEIMTENYEEEQFINRKFPGCWWEIRSNKVVFFLPEDKHDEAVDAMTEYTLKKEKY